MGALVPLNVFAVVTFREFGSFTDVAFYEASRNSGSVPDERFYAALVDAVATWLRH
ncbi:hypothetical protein AB0M39_24785 [Streptomyces sp. NPDC051907]|uniref:hypothetical protein n=1 Tax=Streptomyces sp. NPDC051907 TaxID=3155284 RepID=UPI0034259E75